MFFIIPLIVVSLFVVTLFVVTLFVVTLFVVTLFVITLFVVTLFVVIVPPLCQIFLKIFNLFLHLRIFYCHLHVFYFHLHVFFFQCLPHGKKLCKKLCQLQLFAGQSFNNMGETRMIWRSMFACFKWSWLDKIKCSGSWLLVVIKLISLGAMIYASERKKSDIISLWPNLMNSFNQMRP